MYAAQPHKYQREGDMTFGRRIAGVALLGTDGSRAPRQHALDFPRTCLRAAICRAQASRTCNVRPEARQAVLGQKNNSRRPVGADSHWPRPTFAGGSNLNPDYDIAAPAPLSMAPTNTVVEGLAKRLRNNACPPFAFMATRELS
jgi:hypothetical protein